MAKTWHQLDLERLTLVALLVAAALDVQGKSHPYLAVAEPAPLRFRAPLKPASPALLAALTLPAPALAAPSPGSSPENQSPVQDLANASTDLSIPKLGPSPGDPSSLEFDGQNWDSTFFGTNTAAQVSQPTITAQMLLELLRNRSSTVPSGTNSVGGPVFSPPLPPAPLGSRATYRIIEP
jgi:hypothetical protein